LEITQSRLISLKFKKVIFILSLSNFYTKFACAKVTFQKILKILPDIEINLKFVLQIIPTRVI